MTSLALRNENFRGTVQDRQQRLTQALKQLFTFSPNIEATQNWEHDISKFFERYKPENSDLEVAIENLFLEYYAYRSPIDFINTIQCFSGNKYLMSFVKPEHLTMFCNQIFEKSHKLIRAGQFILSDSGPFGHIGKLAEFIAPYADDEAFAPISMQMEEIIRAAGYVACAIQYHRDLSFPNSCALNMKVLHRPELSHWKEALHAGFSEGQDDAAAHIETLRLAGLLAEQYINEMVAANTAPQSKLSP